MKTYREIARNDGHTDEEIEKVAGPLFILDEELIFVEETKDHVKYAVLDGYYYRCNSSCDVFEVTNDNGDVLESWFLEY